MSFLVRSTRTTAVPAMARAFTTSRIAPNNKPSLLNLGALASQLSESSSAGRPGSSSTNSPLKNMSIRAPLDNLLKDAGRNSVGSSLRFGGASRSGSGAMLGVNGDDIVAKCGGIPASQIPRTGPKAGRSVLVTQAFDLGRALRTLNSINNANKVRQTAMAQTKYEKPGKKLQRIAAERKRRRFDMGIKRLFEMVADARRKGY